MDQGNRKMTRIPMNLTYDKNWNFKTVGEKIIYKKKVKNAKICISTHIRILMSRNR